MKLSKRMQRKGATLMDCRNPVPLTWFGDRSVKQLLLGVQNGDTPSWTKQTFPESWQTVDAGCRRELGTGGGGFWSLALMAKE